ncbi:MAG: hypothetical protein ACRDI0_05290 [Actinomycetota bacterium]
MAVSEPDRHELYQTLERVLGKGPTDTMMSLLPPVGWADVATRHDLEALEARIQLRFEAVDSKMDAMEERLLRTMHQEIASLSKNMVVAIVGSAATVGGLAFGATHLV